MGIEALGLLQRTPLLLPQEHYDGINVNRFSLSASLQTGKLRHEEK